MNRKNLIRNIIVIIVVIVVFLLFYISQKENNLFSRLVKPEISLAQANKLFIAGDVEQAINIYSELIQKGNDLEFAYTGRASAYMSLRRFDEAISDYTEALKIRKSSLALAGRCNAYRIYSLFELALKDCMEATSLDPTDSDSQIALAMLYLEQAKYTESRQVVENLLRNDPNSAMAYLVLARIDMVYGPLEKAIDDLTKAIEIDPNEPQFYWERGFLYYSNGKIKESQADMKKLLEVANPKTDGELMAQAGTLLNTYSGATTAQP